VKDLLVIRKMESSFPWPRCHHKIGTNTTTPRTHLGNEESNQTYQVFSPQCHAPLILITLSPNICSSIASCICSCIKCYVLTVPLLFPPHHPILTPPLIPGIHPHLPPLLFLSSLTLFLLILLISFHALPQSPSA
jgi:hypothetical protein